MELSNGEPGRSELCNEQEYNEQNSQVCNEVSCSALQWLPARRPGLVTRTVDANSFYKTSPGTDPSDWKLHGELYQAARGLWLQDKRRPWSCDGFSDERGFNKQEGIADFFSRKRSFFTNAIAGRSYWCHPPHRLIPQLLKKYKEMVREDNKTAMALVTPYTPERGWWRPLVQCRWCTPVR